MKNLEKRRSSSLAGMSSIALDSFSDSQNFFLAFKSLLVLYWVFLDFCSCKNLSISTSSLLVASSAGLKLATFARFLQLLPRECQLIVPFNIIIRNKPIISYTLFVTFEDNGYNKIGLVAGCCRSRWENLDRGRSPSPGVWELLAPSDGLLTAVNIDFSQSNSWIR